MNAQATNFDSKPSLTPIREEELREAIIAAIEGYDLTESEAWSQLDELSSHTKVEGVEPNPDGIFQKGENNFEVVGTVYVTLNYGSIRDRASMSDSYPIQIRGKLEEGNEIKIDSVEVDTSSFYE